MLSQQAKKAIKGTITLLEIEPQVWQQGVDGSLMRDGKVPKCLGVLLTKAMHVAADAEARFIDGNEASEPSNACSVMVKEAITVWNDQPGRTVADCVQLLRRVLEEGQS